MMSLRRILTTLPCRRNFFISAAVNCDSATDKNSAEIHLTKILQTRFPDSKAIDVQDISGGCGSMYEVWVESKEFIGLSRIKQHRLITETLKEEIKDMHGLRISTTLPKDM